MTSVAMAVVVKLLLLSLFWSLVHSQTFPYVSFMGHNHSYVDLSLVRDYYDGSDSVQCHTDLSTCCSGAQGTHRGDWYFPIGTRLPFFSGVMYECRGAQRVDLRQTSATGPTGIYRCDIPTVAVHDDISVRETQSMLDCMQAEKVSILHCECLWCNMGLVLFG